MKHTPPWLCPSCCMHPHPISLITTPVILNQKIALSCTKRGALNLKMPSAKEFRRRNLTRNTPEKHTLQRSSKVTNLTDHTQLSRKTGKHLLPNNVYEKLKTSSSSRSDDSNTPSSTWIKWYSYPYTYLLLKLPKTSKRRFLSQFAGQWF